MTHETGPNVQQAIPFFWVKNMEASLRFYVDGLAFQRTKKWVVDGKIQWCWLELGRTAIMLQEYRPDPHSPPQSWAKASPSASNAAMPSPSTTKHSLAVSSPSAPSSATTCGSPSSSIPTATSSTSKAPPPSPKKPSTPTTWSYLHPLKNKSENSGVFFAAQNTPVNTPRFTIASTTNSPAKNHALHHVFLKTPNKNATSPRQKN